jgi:hypothetical protein
MIQDQLFPFLREKIGPMTVKHQHLATVLEMTRIDALVPRRSRPPAGGTRGAGASLRCQGGLEPSDHPVADRPTSD